MTYFLSGDFYAERHYESIGHKRRIAFTPQGEVVWSCGCGAKSRTRYTLEAKAKNAHARHVGRAEENAA